MIKYLDSAGLSYLWSKLKTIFVKQEEGKGLSSNDFTNNYKSMLDSVDSAPTDSSANLVTSGGVKAALDNKQDNLTFDNAPTSGSDNPVKSGGIYSALNGKADKLTTGVKGNFMAFDKNGNIADSGHKHSDYLTTHQDITGKADKVSSATNGNFAGLDSNGNLTDSGSKASDFATAAQGAKADAAIPSTEKGASNGVVPLNANGLIDSNYLPSYVDDVIEAYPVTGKTELASDWLALDAAGAQPITPEAGKIYILMADSTTYGTNTQFRYSGSTYIKMNDGGVSSITTAEIDAILAS